MYSAGQGVPRDYTLAFVFVSLADAYGYPRARQEIARAAAFLSPTARVEALSLVSEVYARIEERRARAAVVPSKPDLFEEPNGSVRTGSGFVVGGREHLVTSAHVVEGCRSISATIRGDSYGGSVVGTDIENDLALVRLDRQAGQAAVFHGRHALRIGEDVVVIGFPFPGLLATSVKIATGVVSSLAGPADDSRLIQMTAPVQPGNSGGPVLDASGHVIGVVAAKLDALLVARATGAVPENVAFAIRSNLVQAFLSSRGVVPAVSDTVTVVDRRDIAEAGAAFTALVECEPGLAPTR